MLKIIRRAENGGQNRAALEGFAASAGPLLFSRRPTICYPSCIEITSCPYCRYPFTWDLPPATCSAFPGDQVVLEPEHAFQPGMLAAVGDQPRRRGPIQHVFGETWPLKISTGRVLETNPFCGN